MESSYKGTNSMITGIVFGVITFWLFAQSMVNVVPAVQEDLGVSRGTLSIAISLTALFSGMFIVAAGGIADRVGRKKITYLGLILSIIGSLCLVLAQGATLLIIGRIIQGLSAACIMPSTIALMKTYFEEGPERQRALSFWSIGSWGGSGVCSLAGGAIATYLGWKWIFIFSIIVAILAMLLLKSTPESKMESNDKFRFDFSGLVLLIITLVALNIFLKFGSDLGWTSPSSITAIIVTIIGATIFYLFEKRRDIALIDFSLFKNKPYAGATVSNFLLNGVAGTLVVANTYVQVGRGFTSFQTGLLSIGYLIAVLAMIRVGEKILQRVGAKSPMIWGAVITTVGIAMMGLTFLTDFMYLIAVFLGYALFGLGLGIYATPSTDTSVSNAPSDKVGKAAGIYKMASSLGGAIGVGLSGAVYGSIAAAGNVNNAATIGIMINVIFGVLAILSVWIMVPKNAGKKSVDSTEKVIGASTPIAVKK